ncbi:protein argonaute 4-like [Durio zibethinus]|uniref:Protein argonaute 4-like n=1 Tax=Durio zibethinus TaxID=66656 RepID=A0A6P5XKJ1_DURZI|nr:protein argonaute 4-like [Durio zibethinus]
MYRNNRNASPDGNESPKERGRNILRRMHQSKTFNVEISFAAKIPMQAIQNALYGQESENSQQALRVLDIILRQHAAKRGCLPVRQSFFQDDENNYTNIGGGVLGCRGFHSSFRATQGGLSLNIDVSNTMIIRPGPVLDFLLDNQNMRDPHCLDWNKAKQVLKNLRVKVRPSNLEYKITGLSDLYCKDQMFSWKQKSTKNETGEAETVEITVYEYFVTHRKIQLDYSADLRCINVGMPNRPTYIPMELCTLVSLQRYTKALSTFQRASLVEKSRQKPQERLSILSNALHNSNYGAEPMLRSCGVSISSNFIQVEGRILPAPWIRVGDGEHFLPRNGRWNFNNKRFVEPTRIEDWGVVNFSARCDVNKLVRDLMRCGEMKGIRVDSPLGVFTEMNENRRLSPLGRVEKMFDELQSKLTHKTPRFLLCLLPDRKISGLYGPWKRKNLGHFGIVTQCMAPTRFNDKYLTNLLLKINAKLGGLNSMLSIEQTLSFPVVSSVPTMILGMGVSHGSPGQSDVPSIAAVGKILFLIIGFLEFQSIASSYRDVVNSRQWPSISRYRASVRTQSPKVKMIDSLFKRVSDQVDGGLMRQAYWTFIEAQDRESLLKSSYSGPMNVTFLMNHHISLHISCNLVCGYFADLSVTFYSDANAILLTCSLFSVQLRDGVSESQFNQVLNTELGQIIAACKFLDENWNPKFVVIAAQKSHHTRFFQQGSPDNVLPGTVIDNTICHPQNNDFYLCAHAGMTILPTTFVLAFSIQNSLFGTTRPTHYHVLLDESGYSVNDLQELVHSLSYVYQRSTTAISVFVSILLWIAVAPICYAHLAASQLGTFLKFDEAPETSSSQGGVTASGAVPVPQLPWLNNNRSGYTTALYSVLLFTVRLGYQLLNQLDVASE